MSWGGRGFGDGRTRRAVAETPCEPERLAVNNSKVSDKLRHLDHESGLQGADPNLKKKKAKPRFWNTRNAASVMYEKTVDFPVVKNPVERRNRFKVDLVNKVTK